MAASPPRRRASPPAIPDDLFEEILLRLPPDDPACLLRASLVCKAWSHTVSSPGFRRRLHEHHRTPPVLGVLHNWEDERIPRFIHTTASPFSLAAPVSRSWRAIDCRHGRALFLTKDAEELLVWEPITGAQQRVPVPAAFKSDHFPTAAVFCAVDGCDHRDCLGGHFRVVFVLCVDEEDTEQDPYLTSAGVYSSETGTWGELTSMHGDCVMSFEFYSSVLVGRSLLYFMSDGELILEYDLVRHGLTVFDTPHCQPDYMSDDVGLDYRFNLMLAEGGALGVSEELGQRIKLWTKEPSYGTDAIWVLSRVINLKILLPNDAFMNATRSVQVLGYAEEANVIFVNTDAGLFSIELQSERARRVCDDHDVCNLIPVVSFYTPHSPLERAQELFNKGCKAVEERDFTNAINCFRHALKIRVLHYGVPTPECASTFYRYGSALLSKALEATNPSGNVSRSAPNEESVKSTATTGKNDAAGSSKASGSNTEHVPPLEEGYSEGKCLNDRDQEDGKMTGNGDSGFNRAWKMLNIAEAIVEKSPDKTMEKVDIFCALAEVSMKREGRDRSISYYLKALATLEHLVEPDHIRILHLNIRICMLFKVASKFGDALPYCAKATSVCMSRIQKSPKNAKEVSLDDKDVCASAAEGFSVEIFARILARLQKELEELQKAMSTPSTSVDTTVKRAVSPASDEQNVKSTVARPASLTSSQMAEWNNRFHSPTMSTAATTGSIGSGVDDKTISDEPSPKRLAADDSPSMNEM